MYSSFKDNIWGVDLADIQLISKYNKGIRYLLCAIDLFSKYAFVSPLKVFPVHEKCPDTEFFLVCISCIRSKYRKIGTRKSSVFGQFPRGVRLMVTRFSVNPNEGSKCTKTKNG